MKSYFSKEPLYMWEPKFTPSISVIGGKSKNPNFPWGPGFSARANDKWQINIENMKRQQKNYIEKVDLISNPRKSVAIIIKD